MLVWTLLVVFIEATKHWFGEHRPHFLDLCKPNVKECVTGNYVFDYDCTNPDLTERNLRTMLTSFPSGHSALGVYFSIFLGWLLQCRMRNLETKLLVPTIQTILILYAAFCCITRITDNFHHPHDVLFGILFGAVFSIYNVSWTILPFKRSKMLINSFFYFVCSLQCIFVADNFKPKTFNELTMKQD